MKKFKFNKAALISVIIFNAALFTSIAEAKMYKWVDENGNTHYTQSPPPGDIQGEQIKPPSKIKIDTESAQNQIEQQKNKADDIRSDRQEQAKIEALQKENEAVKKENCKRAHQSMQTYSRPRGLIQQEDGSRIRIDEETRQAGLAESQKKIEEYCQ
jgi:FtsZ-binding cell division protein ZapB